MEERPLLSDPEAAVEPLAALVHKAWVEHRRETGWRFGEKRDDAARVTPMLVPYEQLADAERELDRVTVRRTLRGLRELGYSFVLSPPAGDGDTSRALLLEQADRLIARGQPLLAYDLTKRWLATHPGDEEFQLRNARALRRCGALRMALQLLDQIGDLPDAAGELRGLRAAVHKEMFARAHGRPGAAAHDHLRLAQQLYEQVFEESGGTKYWHGINAATLAFLLGREEDAHALAERVWNSCAAPEQSASEDYWLLATRAEAALVQGRFEVAAVEYRRAVKTAGDRVGDIASTRGNAMLLLDAYRPDAAERRAVETALQPPAVVVFAGHRVDDGGTMRPRFPEQIVADVRDAIGERLQALNAGFGFSGAAPGAEMLFVNAMLNRDPGVASVVLPWPREQFAETHVRAAGASWRQEFEVLFGNDAVPPRVQHVIGATLGIGVDSPLYERFAQQLLFGLARLQARTLLTEVVPLVVWDGAREGSDVGELVAQWETQGVRLDAENVIDLNAISRRRGLRSDERRTALPSTAHTESRVMAILFADVENYSKIPEDRLPAFIEYFVGGIANRLALKPYRAENVRRVGDGLLMVFSNVRDAALCALDLVEWVANHSHAAADGETYWSRVGLPREMGVRVALHAGPIFECVDPLTRARTFEGAHINYAARIEPVTPSNQVYASEAFAALTASWPAPCDEIACEYVGRTSLAKKFGEYPLYHVRRNI